MAGSCDVRDRSTSVFFFFLFSSFLLSPHGDNAFEVTGAAFKPRANTQMMNPIKWQAFGRLLKSPSGT